jgi:Leucine-rich repeat (LRR) protein
VLLLARAPLDELEEYFSPEEMAMTGHVRALMLCAFLEDKYNKFQLSPANTDYPPNHRLAGAESANLTRVFELIGQLPHLVVLDVGRNEWAELPASFYQMPNRGNLRWLGLKHNRLTKLAPGIGEFTGLRVLDLTDNRLEHLPDAIGQLIHLRDLTLNLNKLRTLPITGEKWKELTQVSIIDNNFTEFPSIFRTLKKVNTIYAAHNQIYQIPNWIGEMSDLEYLFLGENPIEMIAEEILTLPHLTDVTLSPKWLHPFFHALLEANLDETFGKLFSPNTHNGMMGRWKKFIPTIIEKIKQNIFLDEWEQNYPFYAKYEQILVPICAQNPTNTAMSVQRLIDRTKSIGLNKKKKILL